MGRLSIAIRYREALVVIKLSDKSESCDFCKNKTKMEQTWHSWRASGEMFRLADRLAVGLPLSTVVRGEKQPYLLALSKLWYLWRLCLTSIRKILAQHLQRIRFGKIQYLYKSKNHYPYTIFQYSFYKIVTIGSEGETFEKIETIFETSKHGKLAIEGILAEKQIKHRITIRHSILPISIGHCNLIMICKWDRKLVQTNSLDRQMYQWEVACVSADSSQCCWHSCDDYRWFEVTLFRKKSWQDSTGEHKRKLLNKSVDGRREIRLNHI